MIQLLSGRRSHSGTGGRRKCLLASLAALMLLVSACSSSKHVSSATANAPNSLPSTSGADIKVMVIAPFTLAAQPSKANYDAVRLQADLQNARGGINGHKVVVLGCDDQSDPNVGAKCAQQAVQEHVVALLGVFTLVADSIWPIINAAGIPSIGLVQYAAADMTSANAWPLTAPAPVANASATGYLAKAKGCKAIADVQANAGANSNLPVELNKEVLKAAGIKYVGPFLLTVTNGLANVPAVARSITSQADCANVALGQNGLTLEKAILQLDPKFRFATNQLSLPTDWATELGTQSTALNGLGGLAPDASQSSGMIEYFKEMKAKASGDALNEFSKLAWASWYAFAQVASTIKADITASSLTDALGKASSVDTKGIAAPVDFTKPTPVKSMTRVFTTKLFVLGAEAGKVVQVGDLVDATTYIPS